MKTVCLVFFLSITCCAQRVALTGSSNVASADVMPSVIRNCNSPFTLAGRALPPLQVVLTAFQDKADYLLEIISEPGDTKIFKLVLYDRNGDALVWGASDSMKWNATAGTVLSSNLDIPMQAVCLRIRIESAKAAKAGS